MTIDTKQALALREVATDLGKSGFFAVSNPAQAFAQVLAGQELGIPPFAAMSQIHIVKGKATLGAAALAGLVKSSSRYNYIVEEHTDDRCAIAFFELWGSEWKKVGVSSFSMDDAKRGGLTNNPTWQKFPRNMLFARAMSNGVKWYTPDITHGAVYHHGELDEEPEQVVTYEVVEEKQQRSQSQEAFLGRARLVMESCGVTMKAISAGVARRVGKALDKMTDDELDAMTEDDIAHACGVSLRPKRREPTPTERNAANAALHGTIGALAKLVAGEDKGEVRRITDKTSEVVHRLVREASGLGADAEWSTVDVDAMRGITDRLKTEGGRLSTMSPSDRLSEWFDTLDEWSRAV